MVHHTLFVRLTTRLLYYLVFVRAHFVYSGSVQIFLVGASVVCGMVCKRLHKLRSLTEGCSGFSVYIFLPACALQETVPLFRFFNRNPAVQQEWPFKNRM